MELKKNKKEKQKNNKKSELIGTENTHWWLLETGGWVVGKMGKGSQKVQTLSYKMNQSGDLMYSMVTIANNNVFYTWNLLRE